MFHRHPFLSVLTTAYLGFVGWMTLTPGSSTPTWGSFADTVVAKLHAHDLALWLTTTRLEFLANVGLFVPVGVFLLLLFGTRLWWLAIGVGFVLTSVIEAVQRDIPGRVSDPRDVIANTAGTAIGVAIGLVLTLPSTLRRRRQRARRNAAYAR